MMGLGFILMLGVWVVIVIAAIWIGKTLLNQQEDPLFPQSKTQKESALEILEIRYARGEITRDEFESMKQDISN